MKPTILIFGVSSFVGSNLLEMLKQHYRIIGTYYKAPVTIAGITCLPCDVLKKEYVSNITARFRPEITIYAIGVSSQKEAHLHPRFSDALNSTGAVNCCDAAGRYDSKFVYFSSGFVMGGEDTVYREGETPFPITVYGTSLSSAEFYIQRSSLNYLIVRCSALYGRSYNPNHGNWFEYLQTAMSKGQALEVDDSVYTGFLDIHIMIQLFKLLLDSGVNNRLFHISSSDFMTRYEFAKIYGRIFKKDEALIVRSAGSFPLEKPKKNSEGLKYYFRLDTSNLEEFINIKVPSIEESLVGTYKRLSGIT